MSEKTDPRTILDKAIRANLGSVHTTAVCRVLKYEIQDGNPIADVQPVNKYRTNRGEFIPAPIFYDVPAPPLSWGPFSIHAPLAVGDFVLVSYVERSMEEFLTTGGRDLEAEDPRRFSDQDAVVVRRIFPDGPGVDVQATRTDALTISTADGATRLEIRTNGQVVIHSSDIFLGSDGATKKVALAEDVEAGVNALINIFNTHIHPVSGGAPPVAIGTATPTLTQATPVSGTGASKVKAE